MGYRIANLERKMWKILLPDSKYYLSRLGDRETHRQMDRIQRLKIRVHQCLKKAIQRQKIISE